MKRSSRKSVPVSRGNQSGFIPMILSLLFVLVVVIIFAFRRVLQVQN